MRNEAAGLATAREAIEGAEREAIRRVEVRDEAIVRAEGEVFVLWMQSDYTACLEKRGEERAGLDC